MAPSTRHSGKIVNRCGASLTANPNAMNKSAAAKNVSGNDNTTVRHHSKRHDNNTTALTKQHALSSSSSNMRRNKPSKKQMIQKWTTSKKRVYGATATATANTATIAATKKDKKEKAVPKSIVIEVEGNLLQQVNNASTATTANGVDASSTSRSRVAAPNTATTTGTATGTVTGAYTCINSARTVKSTVSTKTAPTVATTTNTSLSFSGNCYKSNNAGSYPSSAAGVPATTRTTATKTTTATTTPARRKHNLNHHLHGHILNGCSIPPPSNWKSTKKRLTYHEADDGGVAVVVAPRENTTTATATDSFDEIAHSSPWKKTHLMDNMNKEYYYDQEREKTVAFSLQPPAQPEAAATATALAKEASSKPRKTLTTTDTAKNAIQTKNAIAIRTKTKSDGVHIPGLLTMKQLHEIAKKHHGMAIQYRATYHKGDQPIVDKNFKKSTRSTTTTTNTGAHTATNCEASSKLIQKGTLVIQSYYINAKGNRGGSTFSFDYWKLPGKGNKRESSIYASTRPILAEDGVVNTACSTSGGGSLFQPFLAIDPSLNAKDARNVRLFLKEAKSGDSPCNFFADRDEVVVGSARDYDDFDVDIAKGGDESRVLCDRPFSNAANGVQDASKNMDTPKGLESIPGDNRQAYTSIATSYEKARTKSARKKRKSGEVVSTERKKRRLGTGSKSRSPVSIRFDIQDIRSEFHEEPKCFGLIEGLGGGDEEIKKNNALPHRGRLLELPGEVMPGRWEATVVHDTPALRSHEAEGQAYGNSMTDLQSMRIAIRHNSASVCPLEKYLNEEDTELSDPSVSVSVVSPLKNRIKSFIDQGVFADKEVDSKVEGEEKILNGSFLSCISVVSFDGFTSASEAINLADETSSDFLKNCVSSREYPDSRDLHAIVGNLNDENDEKREREHEVRGILFPCKIDFQDEYFILISQDAHSRVTGIDVIFRRPSIQSPQLSNIDNTKVPLTSYMGLTESVMSEHLDVVSDGDEEMMVRFVEAQTPHKFDPQAHRYVEENTLNDSNQRSSRRSSEHENASVNEVSNYASSKRALDIDYNGHMEDESFSGVDDCILPGIKVGDERENGDNQGAAHNVGSSTADNATTVHQSIENGDKQNSNRTLFAVEHDKPFSKHSGFIVDVAAQAGPTSAEGRLIDGAIDERYVESGSGDCSFDCSPQSYSDNNRTDVVVSKPREALSFGQDLNIGISGAPTDDGRERTNTKCKEYKKMTGMSRKQAIVSGVGRDNAEESQPVLRHKDLSSSRQIRGMHQNNSILPSKKPEPTNDDQLRPCYLSAGTTAIGVAAIHVAEVVSRPGIQSTNKHTSSLGESDHRLQHQLTYPSERIVKHDSVGNNLFVPESNIRPLPKIIRRSSGVGNASTSAFRVNDNGPIENQKLEFETFVAIEPNSEMCHSSRLSRNTVKDKAGQSKEALQAKEGNGFIEDVNATTESSFQRDSNTEIHPKPDFRVNRLFGVEVRTPGINVLAEKRNNAFDFSSLQKSCNKRHGQHHSLSRKVSFSNRKCSPDNVVSLGRTHNSHGSLSASRGQESRQQRNKAVVKVDRRVPSPQLSRSNPHVHSIPRTNSGRRSSSEAKGRAVKVKVEQSHSGNMRLLSGKRSKKIHIVDDLFDDSDSCFGCEIIAYTKAPKNNSILLKKHSKGSTTTPDCITSDPGMFSKMSKHRTDQRKRKVSKGEIPTNAPPPKIRNHGAENINDCISIMNKTCIARTRSIKVNLPESEFDSIGGVDNFQEDDAFDSPSKIVSTNNFFDIYFGQESDEFASHSSAQSHLLHQCNSDQFSNFHDYYFGQELYLEAHGDATKNERNASQTSHSKPQLRRFTLLFAFTLLASILPQSLPPYPLLLPSRQFYHPVFSVFEYDHNASDVNATTNHTHEEKSWWAKLYSY